MDQSWTNNQIMQALPVSENWTYEGRSSDSDSAWFSPDSSHNYTMGPEQIMKRPGVSITSLVKYVGEDIIWNQFKL